MVLFPKVIIVKTQITFLLAALFQQRVREEYVSLSDVLSGPTALFLSIGSLLTLIVYSARILGNSTHTSLLVTHYILLTTHLETRDSSIPAYDIITAFNGYDIAAHQLNVYCSIDSPFYAVAAAYPELSILHTILESRLALSS